MRKRKLNKNIAEVKEEEERGGRKAVGESGEEKKYKNAICLHKKLTQNDSIKVARKMNVCSVS